MYLNKEKLTQEIDSYARGIEETMAQEVETHSHYGISDMVDIGEFAFPDYEDQFDYDMLVEDHTESCKAEANYDGEIEYATWSSKSGTSVFLEPFDYEGYTDGEDIVYDLFSEIDYDYGMDATDFTREELLALYNEIKKVNEEVCEEREAYDKTLIRCIELIKSTAYGVKTASFSNGESIFEPTEAYEGATETFTPYYNPNEEAV